MYLSTKVKQNVSPTSPAVVPKFYVSSDAIRDPQRQLEYY
jgi:hypothetical protein